MSTVLQHALALTIVAGCLGYVLWQTARTLLGKQSRSGNCCATGCVNQADRKPTGPAASASGLTGGTGRVVFVPIEMLGRGRKH